MRKKIDIKDIVNKKLIENYIYNNNLTKTKFCKICKISYSTLNRILSGKDFKMIALFKIARIMNIRVCNLFNR